MNKRTWGGGEREKKKDKKEKPSTMWPPVIYLEEPNLWLTTLNNINITEYTEYTL